jgi:5-formyltetrahydrofolate cyclo-ligase
MRGAGPPGDPAARKRALRSQARRAAAAVPRPERARRSREVEGRLLTLPELASARAVALYAPLPDEVQLDVLPAWLSARGCRVAYPRMEGDGLVLHWIGGGAALRAGPRGLQQPAPDSPPAPLEGLDAILLPGLLFDRAGRRLGRGGGHYDRLLARAPAVLVRIGLCLAEQLIDELPSEPHDVLLGRVATDQEVLRIS